MATVMIDAGHGGWDNGASYNGRAEKTDNLNLALAVGNILANNGVDVLYTRTDDVYQSPSEKARIANESGADYFISIHRNASPQPNMYSGVQTLVYEDAGAPSVLAQNIDNELEKLGFSNLGTSVRKDLAVLRRTRMPAALVEAGFLNTDQDNQLFDLKFPEIAQAIATGILQSLSSFQEGGQTAASQEADLYAVEVGRFRHPENAKMLVQMLQEEGYDAYIHQENPYYSVYHGGYGELEAAQLAEEKLYQQGFETRLVKNRF